jgi:hypothetical protein
MDIGDFRKFSEQKFSLSSCISQITEHRKRPQIPLATVLHCVLEMVALGQKSLLEVDQKARSPGAKAWYGVKKRALVVSDSTLERVVGQTHLAEARTVLHQCVQAIDSPGDLSVRLGSGRLMRVGLVDGSHFGGFPGCLFAVAGMVATPVDIQMYTQGKELPASRQLLSRIAGTFGKRVVDMVIGDGLYISKDHIIQCKQELGGEALVKTTEKGLSLIQDAEGLFRMAGDSTRGIEYVEGLDSERGVRYQVIAAGEFQWDDLPYRFQVARIEEEKLKPKPGQAKHEMFWVITTDPSLSGLEMRELGHLRWRIENNVFKRLNELVGSKRGWIRNGQLKAVLLVLWLVGLLLFGYYLVCRGLAKLRQRYGQVRQTWKFATRVLWGSMEKMCLAED